MFYDSCSLQSKTLLCARCLCGEGASYYRHSISL